MNDLILMSLVTHLLFQCSKIVDKGVTFEFCYPRIEQPFSAHKPQSSGTKIIHRQTLVSQGSVRNNNRPSTTFQPILSFG